VIGGATRVFAILGDPVAHSLSPVMQNAAFTALGLPAVYVPLRCTAADLPPLVGALARASGGGNITVPHKELAASSVDRCLEQALLLGACNTFWGEAGESVGDNTDVAGVCHALEQLEPPDGAWLILGTGGGARAAVGAARLRGANIAVVSRAAERQEAFGRWAASLGVDVVPAEECRIVINATPAGLHDGDTAPTGAPSIPPQAKVALDMVYAQGETRWVRAMRAAGLRVADGRAMLVAQGAAAFERWFPDERAPAEVMRAAVDAALR
jgi:shikimate dehydrogenase